MTSFTTKFIDGSARLELNLPDEPVNKISRAVLTQLAAWVVVAPLAFGVGLFFTNTPAPGRMMLATAVTHVAYGLSLTLSLHVAGVRATRT